MKLRFTAEEQARYLNRMEAIQHRAMILCNRTVWMPEPWSKEQHKRAKLLYDLMSAWTARRMGWGDYSYWQ